MYAIFVTASYFVAVACNAYLMIGGANAMAARRVQTRQDGLLQGKQERDASARRRICLPMHPSGAHSLHVSLG